VIGGIAPETGRRSISVASCTAEETPQINPPISWLLAVVGSTTWPAAKAPTTRGQRISRVFACTRTSTNSAPKASDAVLELGPACQHGVALVELLSTGR